MSMKHFLFWATAAGFLSYLTMKAKSSRTAYNKLVTRLVSIQEEITNLHNDLRRGVDPPASDMQKMSWSEEAAQNARIIASYCDTTKSNPLERRLPLTFCGENMYLSSFPISWTNVIKLWYNESKHFNYGHWTSTDEAITTDHYTQIVWATSYLIGCGIALCRKKGLPDYHYVCHYCHEGNDPDTMNVPYKNGTPCEHCPKNCENKLCSAKCSQMPFKLFCKATCLCGID
ncbi:cysteine-rich secretory protein 1 isoform X2 [Tupaia chinensis]|uniref:cysteine-rich secretory protein 1 isoform X2 n=1 Tax=Tupaia chinensis TaxID=246437 RepID=UPI000703DB6F|nr:cysteine-rich secretory protein 1 isoform X2 [Tupaia chinensis]